MSKPDKILAHELLDREVLNLHAGEVAGSVVDFGINRDGKVELIGILPTAWYGGGKGITPGSITFLTNDRLCVANGEALTEFAPDGEKLISTNSGGQIYGKSVLCHDGEMLGELVDFRFNLSDGKITDLLVLDGEQRRTRVPVESISTIGKDYIIIERSKGESGEAAAGEDAPPFVEAAVVEQPAAASSTLPEVSRSGRKGRGVKVAAPAAPEPVAQSAPPEAATAVEEDADAAAGSASDAPEHSAREGGPEPEKPGNSVTASLDAVFKLNSSSASAEPEASLISSTTDSSQHEQSSLGVSKFDQKKIDFLRGKQAHRDIKDPDGVILVAQGETFDQPALVRLHEGGVLGEVFIEMTLRR